MYEILTHTRRNRLSDEESNIIRVVSFFSSLDAEPVALSVVLAHYASQIFDFWNIGSEIYINEDDDELTRWMRRQNL